MKSRMQDVGVLLAYLRPKGPWTEGGIALIKPRFEEVNGQRFVVGQVPEALVDWTTDLEAAVRWDEVVHYLVFDSVEDFNERVAQGELFYASRSDLRPQ